MNRILFHPTTAQFSKCHILRGLRNLRLALDIHVSLWLLMGRQIPRNSPISFWHCHSAIQVVERVIDLPITDGWFSLVQRNNLRQKIAEPTQNVLQLLQYGISKAGLKDKCLYFFSLPQNHSNQRRHPIQLFVTISSSRVTAVNAKCTLHVAGVICKIAKCSLEGVIFASS